MTDETKHAPEPWRMDDESSAHDGIVDAGGHLCAESWAGDTMNLDPLEPEQFIARQDANARRIVACVNACAGIPTAALEAGALAKLLDATAVLFGSPVRTDDAQAAWDAMDAALRALGRGTR